MRAGPDLVALVDFTAQEILDAAKVDGLPVRGKLWTLRIEDDAVLLRIAAVNNTPQPRQPPPPPAKPVQPKPPPPPPPAKPGGK